MAENPLATLLGAVSKFLFLATIPRRRDIIGHWAKPYTDLQLSSLEFYASLAEVLRKQQVPELIIMRKNWKESGLLSSRRDYLRIGYGPYSCDVCAAPFGVNFFFSCWTYVMPRKFSWRNLLGMATTVIALVLLLLTGSSVASLLILIASVVLVALCKWMGLIQSQGQFDEYLSGLTIFGPLWDILRPPSSFEFDTAQMFHDMVQTILMQMIDKVTEVHGLEPLTEKERAPVLRELMMK